MATDPTMTFLEQLDDPSKWKVVRGVPIFKPHTRKVGGATITVSEQDLADIVLNARQAKRQSGVVPRIAPGHIKLDPNCPETAQPEPWGWIPDCYVGTFGPASQPAILADFYFKPQFYEQAKAYPFRSVEYYHGTKEITGVALLKRDPQLDLGVLQYSNRTGCYQYAMEDDSKAADPAKPPTGEETSKAKPVMSDDPVWQYFVQQYQQAMMGAGTGGGAAPAAGEQPAQMSKHLADAVHYLRIQNEQLVKRIDGVEAKNREDQTNYQREKSRRVVDHLIYDGYQLPDPAREVERMAGLTDAARLEREQEIRTCYQRAPVGRDYLPVREDAPPSQFHRDPNEFTAANLERAEQYMREHPGCDWEQAREYAMGKAK